MKDLNVNKFADLCLNVGNMKGRLALILIFLIPGLLQTEAAQPERGYRGFVEWANEASIDVSLHDSPTDSKYYTGVSVSQGYQFNPYLFVGGGIMVEQLIDAGDLEDGNRIYSAPVFAEVRSDMKFGRFTPFVDARIGYNFSNYGGIYFSPMVGYRIGIYRKIGINISVGYSMTGNRNTIEKVVTNLGPDGMSGTNTTYHRTHTFNGTFAFRLGFDF